MGIKHEDTKVSGQKGYASEWNKDHVIDGNVDFQKFEAENFVIHSDTSFPSAPVEGQLFYKTSEKKLFMWDGSVWVLLNPSKTKYAVTAVDEWIVPGGMTQVKDLLINITTTRESRIIAYWGGQIWPDNTNANPYVICVMRRDGVQKLETYRNVDTGHSSANEQRACISAMFSEDLSPGNYSIDVVGFSNNSTGIIKYRYLYVFVEELE